MPLQRIIPGIILINNSKELLIDSIKLTLSSPTLQVNIKVKEPILNNSIHSIPIIPISPYLLKCIMVFHK